MDETAGKLIRYTEAIDDESPKKGARRQLAENVLVRFLSKQRREEFERLTGLINGVPVPSKVEGTLLEVTQ